MGAVTEDRQCIAGEVAIVTGELDRIADRMMALHQSQRLREFVRRLIAILERAPPEIALFR